MPDPEGDTRRLFATEGMSRAERTELGSLLRRREKLAKADVEQVAAERLADFEANMAEIFDAHDEAWRDGLAVRRPS